MKRLAILLVTLPFVLGALSACGTTNTTARRTVSAPYIVKRGYFTTNPMLTTGQPMLHGGVFVGDKSKAITTGGASTTKTPTPNDKTNNKRSLPEPTPAKKVITPTPKRR